MINLQEIISKSDEVISQPSAQAQNDDVEKLASALEAYAEEDTLMDKLAELAVLVDQLNFLIGIVI